MARKRNAMKSTDTPADPPAEKARAFDLSPAGLLITSYPDGRVLDVNEAFLQICGFQREQMLNRDLSGLHLWPDEWEREWIARRLSESGKMPPTEVRIRRNSGEKRVVLLAATRTAGRGPASIVWSAQDVTTRHLVVEEIRKREELSRSQAERNAAVVMLAEQALGAGGLPVLLDQALATIDQLLAAELAAVLEWLPGEQGLRIASITGLRPGSQPASLLPLPDDSVTAQAIRYVDPVVVEDLALRPDWTSALGRMEMRSLASIPIRGKDRPAGVLEVFRAAPPGFQPEDVHFLQLIANFLAVAFERVRSEAEIHRQQESIRQLSTPVLRVRKGMLVLPLIGLIDEARASQMTGQLLAAIRGERARAVVIDLTGVVSVDSIAARRLLFTFDSARLLGAETIVCGLSRQISHTLTDLGVSFGSIRVARDLQGGLEEAELSLSKRGR